MKATVALVLAMACSSSGAAVETVDAAADAARSLDSAAVRADVLPADLLPADALPADALPVDLLSADHAPAREAGTDDGGGVCTDLVNIGEVVVPKIAAASAMPPPASGGAITPGVYVLTEVILYELPRSCSLYDSFTQPASFTERITVESPTRGRIEQASAPLQPGVITHAVRDYYLLGERMIGTMTCPVPLQIAGGYAAGDSELVTFEDYRSQGCGLSMVVRRRVER